MEKPRQAHLCQVTDERSRVMRTQVNCLPKAWLSRTLLELGSQNSRSGSSLGTRNTQPLGPWLLVPCQTVPLGV